MNPKGFRHNPSSVTVLANRFAVVGQHVFHLNLMAIPVCLPESTKKDVNVDITELPSTTPNDVVNHEPAASVTAGTNVSAAISEPFQQVVEPQPVPPPGLPLGVQRNWVWFYWQMVFRMVFYPWMGYRVSGSEQFNNLEGGLILSNHQSMLDPLLLPLAFGRPVTYLARSTLFEKRFLGAFLRKVYVVPIDRDAARAGSLREMQRRLEQGFLVGIFPEGTRSIDGEMGPLKPGFLALMRRGKVPVYPAGIAGAHLALPRGKLMLRPRRVRVVFGKPILPEEIAAYSKQQDAELIELVRQRITACAQAAEAWRRGGPAPEGPL